MEAAENAVQESSRITTDSCDSEHPIFEILFSDYHDKVEVQHQATKLQQNPVNLHPFQQLFHLLHSNDDTLDVIVIEPRIFCILTYHVFPDECVPFSPFWTLNFANLDVKYIASM